MNNSRCSSCGFINFATAAECKKCGNPIKRTANVNASAVGEVWRDDDKLVMQHGAELPDRCIVCNAPAQGRRYPLKLTFDHELHKLPLVVGTAKISYKETELPVGLCRTHFMRQAYSFLAGILLIVGGLASFVFFLTREDTVIMLSGMAGSIVIAGIGGYLYQSTPIQIEKSEESKFWLKGVCSAFLLRLPNWQ